MLPISGETCEICGERLPGLQRSAENQSCSACRESAPLFAKAAAYGAYDAELRELIHLLKYERVTPAAYVLGSMMANAIGKLPISGPVLVVPVPLHSSKKRQRGFNQAELIARQAMRRSILSNGKLAADILARVRPTESQIGLTRPQRTGNIRGAFQVVHPSKVAGQTILLVDDVLTTGTTASECARVLKKAGAQKVWVATVARTLKIATGVEPQLQFVSAAQAS